jgi:hypothetical protein
MNERGAPAEVSRMAANPADVPYEAQQDGPDGRRCGAAALCMALRSLGVACSQEEVWPAVSRPGGRGVRRARTLLLCREALRRGLEAVIVQARHPWEALRRCGEQAGRCILHHRTSPTATGGHYSVLVGVDEEAVVVHDPLAGPARRLARDEFLALWRPSLPEVAGHVFVALARGSPADKSASCPRCGAAWPGAAACPWCRTPFALPPAVLGCVADGCRERTWGRVFCPSCDGGLTAVLPPPNGV